MRSDIEGTSVIYLVLENGITFCIFNNNLSIFFFNIKSCKAHHIYIDISLSYSIKFTNLKNKFK